MSLANITFILAVWCAVAVVAGILIGTMMATQDKQYAEASDLEAPLATRITRVA